MNRSYGDVTAILAKSGMNITPTVSLSGGFFTLTEKYPELLQNKQFLALYSDKYRKEMLAGWAMMVKINPGYKANFGAIQKTVRTLIDAGAHVTAGTGSPFIPYGHSLHIELQNFVDGGLTPYEALRSATLWAAEAVGVEKDPGSLEPGKLANLVIVKGNPLERIQDAWNVITVMKNGQTYTILSTNF